MYPVIVLIESDWNLKYAFIAVVSTSTAVLIESDWNLKCFWKTSVIPARVGINRIRLEFKDNTNHCKIYGCKVLIESDWNLKLYAVKGFEGDNLY